MKDILWRYLVVTGLALLAWQLAGQDARPAEVPSARVTKTNYHRWPESLLMSNGKVEVVVVPQIGRVMQFRFSGEETGPFWENRELDGKSLDPDSKEWGNFGGDKTWPAPQADWPKVTDRAWPPPRAFDSLPVTASVKGEEILLTSTVDPHYGIRTERRVRLEPGQPRMVITTVYEKVSGLEVRVAVWTITQLKDPVAAVMPIPAGSRYADGFNLQSEARPPSLARQDSQLTLQRDRKAWFKIGNDSGVLIWKGKELTLRIESPRESEGEYPDQGSSAEIYTNPDPLEYVELEMLGPLHTMRIGDKITRMNRYELSRTSAAGGASR